jgi:CBS domain-containing protein
MDTVSDLLHAKGPGFVGVSSEASVREAAHVMNRHGIGSVLVVDDGRLVGIFTERDVLRRVVAESRHPESTLVREVMTVDVICCGPNMPADDVAELMRARRVRHLPVIDDEGSVLGLVSIGDVNAHRFATCEVALHQVQDYMLRRA